MGSVAPSTLVATPLPWISKGSPLPSLSLSTFPFFWALPEQVEEPWTFSVGPSTLVPTPLPWISKGSPLPPSPSSLFLPQPRSCTTLGASWHRLLLQPCTEHSICTIILLLVVNSKVIIDYLERIKIR